MPKQPQTKFVAQVALTVNDPNALKKDVKAMIIDALSGKVAKVTVRTMDRD